MRTFWESAEPIRYGHDEMEVLANRNKQLRTTVAELVGLLREADANPASVLRPYLRDRIKAAIAKHGGEA